MGEDEWEFSWRTLEAAEALAPGESPQERGAREPIRPGQVFAGYRINALLGQGGMGAVFLATDPEAGRDVALKVLHEKATPTQLERLRREGELTAKLDHPGIVRVHAGGDVGGRPYLAYALVPEARPLDEAWAELPRQDRVRLLQETARAVGHAHDHGIVHRDLKAENVLVDAAGEPHVVDFGLARHVDHERLTQTGAIMGTPVGMAPEQFLAERDRIGPPTDVFALGILLYRALTDELPFEASGWVELARMVAEGRVTPIRRHVSDVPAPLDRICRTCLAVEPEDRYPDANALADDLDAFLSGRPLSSASSWARARRIARRPVRALIALAMAGLLLAVVSLVLTRSWQVTRLEGELRRLVAGLDPDDPAQRETLARRLSASPDLPAELRCAAELALAGGSPLDVAGWRVRLDHARRAGAIDPARADAALREAACLLALEDPVGAIAAVERVGSSALEARRLLARAYLAADRPADALAQADARLPSLRARALFAAGRRAEARELAAAVLRERPGAASAVLAAELERGRSDWIGRLHELVRIHTDHAAPRAALARAYLRLGSASLAAETLRGGPPELAPAAELVTCAFKTPGETGAGVADAALGWRRPTLGWLLHAARRALDWRKRAHQPGRRARFAQAITARLKLARALCLTAWQPERRSIAALEARLDEPSPPAPDPKLLQEAAAALAEVNVQRRKGLLPDRLALAYRGVLERFPAYHRAQIYIGKVLIIQGKKREGLREYLRAVLRQPSLNRFLHADCSKVYDGQFYMRRDHREFSGSVEDDLDRLRLAYELTVHLEHVGKKSHALSALLQLDRILAGDPSNTVARTLRGFVLLRLGRLAQAEWDLSLATVGAPLDAVTAFYRLLVWTALERPPHELRRELKRAVELGFVTWDERNWNPNRYPEVQTLLDSGPAGFEALAGKHGRK